MVDIIRLPFFEQISVPKRRSHTFRNDYANNKQWIGRCPGDPPRKLNISELPSLQRKIIDQQMARCYSVTVDRSPSMKMKPQQQRNNNREPLKVTTVSSNSILSNIDETDSRLFETLSKHFTIKAEPLRPVSNNFLNNSTSTQSSWQRYWASTNPPRERKETNDFHLPPIRPKRNQSSLTTVRDSSTHIIASTFNTKPSTPTLSDRQSSATRDDRTSMNSSKSSLPIDNEINALTSKIYKLPLPSNHSKLNKSILKKRSKSLERKPTIASKSNEKKETKPVPSKSNTPVPKQRKTPIPSNKSQRTLTKKQQQSLSSVMTTTPRSKYGPQNWDEPYVGTRFDPPTPPSSPSYFPWSEFNDQYDYEIPYVLNSIDEIYF